MPTRQFVPLLLSTLLFLAAYRPTAQAAEFQLDWSGLPDRHWLGAELWGNRLHDWQVRGERLECLTNAPGLPMRTVHLLTHRLADKGGRFEITVRCGMAKPPENVSRFSAAGFLIGVGGTDMDYRSAALVHQWPGPGAGIFCGVRADGQPFITDFSDPKKFSLEGSTKPEFGFIPSEEPFDLTLTGEPTKDGKYRLKLVAKAVGTRSIETNYPAERLIGNIALVSHCGSGEQTGRWWFQKWTGRGEKIDQDADRALGPIVCCQHTLSEGVLKLTAQLMPIGDDCPRAFLQLRKDGEWKTVSSREIIAPGWTVPFRIEDWDDTRDHRYRVGYRTEKSGDHYFEGTIRKDPVDKPTIVVAGFTGNHNCSHRIGGPNSPWADGVWFPHAEVVRHVAAHKPDVLFFSGDQVYEGGSPTFADRQPENIKLDYLYKWYLWCWAYRDLTRDIPAVTMPDDHDVYQGNLWGQGGRKSPGRDHDGGYVHPADFVKMVERTQTSHLPDPYDPTPVAQGIGVYYCPMTYGRISFAVLEDRKFKSGCNRPDMPPSGTGRPDHFNDPDFDVAKLDIPGVQLLGERQLKFLDEWAQDWSGADMKMALSQTIFANMATHHGGGLDRLIADLDSNGWSQTGRNKALDALRRGFAFHLAGDQHLATIVHHGIEEHGDAIWSFCVPSVANFYPRAWAPEVGEPYKRPEPKDFTGERRDGFGHPVTVYAATNPGKDMGHEPADLHDKMPGYGIVRMNKTDRTITMECWPRFADPTDADAKQYEGWPKTIRQTDNYARRPAGHLPTLKIQGLKDPVVQVINEQTGEVEYMLRISGDTFRPMVFAEGRYSVRVGEPSESRVKTITGLEIAKDRTIEVEIP